MSVIQTNTDIAPFVIKQFLGLNLTKTGDTQIKDGESGNMDNFVITNDYKLKKADGYKTVYDFGKPIRGLYEYKTGAYTYLLIAVDGKLYRIEKSYLDDDSTWDNLTPTLVGSIADSDTTFFLFDGKVYILTGSEYKSYDGTTLQDVDGYVPLVFIGTPPAGGGTEYDPINILTGKKHQQFNGDGSSVDYYLAQDDLANASDVYKVIVDGIELSSGYSVNKTTGVVTFDNPPSVGNDNVDIYWTKNDGDRSLITAMRAGIVFGGDVDTKVFLYGSATEPNRIRYSATAGGVPSAEYFPAVNQVDVGVSNFKVTDCTRQYDRLIITTNKPEAYYLTIDLIDVNGYSTPSVQTFPLNEVHGNIAFAQGQLLNNDPVTIEQGQIIRWKSTNVRDERNMSVISEKIKDDLVDYDLTGAKTCDFQDKNQYWLSIGSKIYIYNYVNDTYSRLNLPEEGNQFYVVGRNMYMATNGRLVKWAEEYQTYEKVEDGVLDTYPINAHWEMNFSNFGASYLRKTLRKVWVTMQPQANSSAVIGYITNKNISTVRKTIKYSFSTLEDVDFEDWSFEVSYNPQPFRLKLKAKKWTNLKLTIDNKEGSDCTILELALKMESSGESK